MKKTFFVQVRWRVILMQMYRGEERERNGIGLLPYQMSFSSLVMWSDSPLFLYLFNFFPFNFFVWFFFFKSKNSAALFLNEKLKEEYLHLDGSGGGAGSFLLSA